MPRLRVLCHYTSTSQQEIGRLQRRGILNTQYTAHSTQDETTRREPLLLSSRESIRVQCRLEGADY